MVNLAKVKVGEAKVQLALINTGDGDQNVLPDRQALIDLLEESEKEQDKTIEVESTYETEEDTE